MSDSNKTFWKSVGIAFFIVGTYAIVGYFIKLVFPSPNQPINIPIDYNSGGTIGLSGSTSTGIEIIIPPLKLSEKEKFEGMKKAGFSQVFNPPIQPKIPASASYTERSNILNKWLSTHNYFFSLKNSLNNGYLYIKLSKPIGNSDIFLYFHDTLLDGYPISGYLIQSKNLIEGSDTEFLYSLDEVALKLYYKKNEYNLNWLNTLNKTDKPHYIGGYITTANENSIEEFNIVGE